MQNGVISGRTDVVGIWQGFADITVNADANDSFTIVYPTRVRLNSQECWMLKQLAGAWIDGLSKAYRLKCESVKIIGGNVVVEAKLPGRLNFGSIPDGIFTAELAEKAKKHFSDRIRREYPLPFKTDFSQIPMAAGVGDCYKIYNCLDGATIGAFPAGHWDILTGDGFRESLARAVAKAKGELIKLVPNRDDPRYFGYTVDVTLARSYEITPKQPDAVIRAVGRTLKRFFKKENYLLK